MHDIDLAPPETQLLSDAWLDRRQEVLVTEITKLRQKELWRRRAIVSTAAAAIVALVAVLGLGVLGGSTAYAGWSAIPTQPSPAQVATVSTTCQSTRAQISLRLPQLKPGPLPPYVVGDFRGPYAALLYVDSQQTWVCFVTPSGPSLLGGNGSESSFPSNSDAVSVGSAAVVTNQGAPFRLVTGQANADVTSVSFNLSDGTVVTASLTHGYLVAWWPGTASIASTTYTANGTIHQS